MNLNKILKELPYNQIFMISMFWVQIFWCRKIYW